MNNNLFCNARITLKDGTKLEERDPHILRTIIHQQLHTQERRIGRKLKAKTPRHKVMTLDTPAASKRKAKMRHHNGVEHIPEPIKNLPVVVKNPTLQPKDFKGEMNSMDHLIRYH